jgi:hypothetical protein
MHYTRIGCLVHGFNKSAVCVWLPVSYLYSISLQSTGCASSLASLVDRPVLTLYATSTLYAAVGTYVHISFPSVVRYRVFRIANVRVKPIWPAREEWLYRTDYRVSMTYRILCPFFLARTEELVYCTTYFVRTCIIISE